MSGEGDEAMSPFFATANAPIEASNASLESLIACLFPAGGIVKEATLPTAIKLLIAVRTLFSCANGERLLRHLARRLALRTCCC